MSAELRLGQLDIDPSPDYPDLDYPLDDHVGRAALATDASRSSTPAGITAST